MGGNSTKATSGINGAGTNSQRDLDIPDTAKIFFDDTKKSVTFCPPDFGNRGLNGHNFYRLETSLATISFMSLLVVLEMR